MKNIAVLFITLIMVSCGSQKTITEDTEEGGLFLYNNWKLISMGEDLIKAENFENPKQMPQIKFTETDSRFFGSDGCNSISGSVERTGETGLKFGPMMGTKMACMDMSIPDKFALTLAKVNSFQLISMMQQGGGKKTPTHYLHLFDHNEILLMRFEMTD